MRNIVRQLCMCGLVIMLLGCYVFAEEMKPTYANALRFRVTMRPQGEEDKDAISADLYMTPFLDSGWVRYREPCTVEQKNGDTIFRCSVEVSRDGGYYFLSRGVDAAGRAPEPTKESPAQQYVIVDTTLPVFELTNPLPGQTLRIGEDLRIEWMARDENFGETPIQLYARIGENDWQMLGAPQENNGIYMMTVPDTGGQPLQFKGTATDLAGNIIEDLLPGSFPVRDPADAGRVDTPETEAIIVEMPSNPRTMPTIPDVPENKEAASQDPATRTAPPYSPVSEYINENDAEMNDPRPKSRHPEFTANDGSLPAKYGGQSSARAAYIAYIMAGNLVRQGRLKDSLRYYRTAVDADPNFDQAWNDMAMVYKELGAFMKADAAMVRALTIEPRDPQYIHNRGEIYQTAGLAKLQDPASGDEELAHANELIHFAIKMYGRALEYAQRKGRLAERAATYFRLGEICYFANQDPVGARQYWLKVLDLHTPTPDLDNVMIDRGSPDEARTRQIYRKNTELRVNLETWQNWARAYLRQLNDMERGVAPVVAISGAETDPYRERQLSDYQIQQARAAATPSAYMDRPSTADYGRANYGASNGVQYKSKAPPVVNKPRALPLPDRPKPKKEPFWRRLLSTDKGGDEEVYRSREAGDWRNEYVPYNQY